MTVTTTDVRNWIGVSTALLSDTQLGECITMGQEYVAAQLQKRGVGGTSDPAVRYMTAMFAWMNMDARGVKPQSLKAGELTIGSDIKAQEDQFQKLADAAISAQVLISYGNKRDAFVKRLRGGRGMP